MRSWVRCARLVAAGLGIAAVAAGCGENSSGDCAANGTCPPDAGTDGAGESNVVVEAGGGADAIADARVDVSDGTDGFTCDFTKGPSVEPCVIVASQGVFVAPAANGGSDTSGDGSMASPFATIGHALSHLGGTARVYVCDGSFAEQVTMMSATAASIYGGLACPQQGDRVAAAWTYVGGTATVTSPAPSFALSVTGVTRATTIADVTFVSPDATGTDAQGNGNSSIAALISGSTVNMVRVTLKAGAGANGSPGADGASAPNYSGATAQSGGPGAAPGGDAGTGQGAGGAAQCAVYGMSNGGLGGVAGTGGAAGGSGVAGSSLPAATTSAGYDGVAGTGGLTSCPGGDPGANGAAGAAGAAATSNGLLSSSGWTPTAGASGRSGAPGQGGGGGGGRGEPSSGGNGGGAGGCGGSAGTGGGGGGGSIALASIACTITLASSTLTTGAGGTAGKGGDGENGEGGGNPGGDPRGLACAGGPGGNGAGGSGGAGGTAGISVAIVYTRTLPTYDATTSLHPGSAGQPGPHGAAGAGGTNGLPAGKSGNPGADGFTSASASGDTLQGG